MRTTSIHYPFGMLMYERSFSSPAYRYGFNGKEKDNEINVEGGDYDFGARIYDGRLGRWLSLDKLQKKYPNLSPYNFCANTPILFIDPDGRKIIKPTGEYGKVFEQLLSYNIPEFNEMCNLFAPNTDPSIEKNIEFLFTTMLQYAQRPGWDQKMPYGHAVKSDNNNGKIFMISNFATGFNKMNQTEGQEYVDRDAVNRIINAKEAFGDTFTPEEKAQWEKDNTFKLEPSELCMAIGLFHEMIHVKHFLIDNLPGDDPDATHNKMAVDDIGKIQAIVRKYGEKNNIVFADGEVEALSYSGLEKTPAFATYINAKAGIPDNWKSATGATHAEYKKKADAAWENYQAIQKKYLTKRNYINKK